MEDDNENKLDEQGLPDEETVGEEPTDEELSAAFDELVGLEDTDQVDDLQVEVVSEEPEKPKELTDEEKRHAEDSRLGRKVAKIESRFENVATKEDLQMILKKLDDLGRNKEVSYHQADDDYDRVDEVDLQSPDGLRTFLSQEREREAKNELESKKKYESNYIETLRDLISEIDDPDIKKIVKAEMYRPGGECNKLITGVPEKDCARNYAKALKIALAKKAPSTIFDKKDRVPKVPTGVSGSSTSQGNKDTLKHELDEYSKALVKDGKLSIADINEALDGEAPMNLRGRNG